VGKPGWVRAVREQLRRHRPHLVAESALVIVAAVATPISNDFRVALALAALAAFLVSAATIEAEHYSRRADRAAATETLRASAEVVLAVQLTYPTGLPPMEHRRRVVTMREAGRGQHLDLSGSAQQALALVHDALTRHRLEFAALVGTQISLIEIEAQRHALTAERRLDAAIAHSSVAMDLAWRHDVLRSSGLDTETLAKFSAAYFDPVIAALHEALEEVADACEWLASSGEQIRDRRRRETHDWPTRADAARAVVARLVADAIENGVETNWLDNSSLVGIPKYTMRAVAIAPDLTFTGQAAGGNGWGSLQSMLTQQAQLFESGLGMIGEDLTEAERSHASRVLACLKAAWKAAHDAGESEKVAANVRTEQRAADAIAVADETYFVARKRFIKIIADGVREADAAL